MPTLAHPPGPLRVLTAEDRERLLAQHHGLLWKIVKKVAPSKLGRRYGSEDDLFQEAVIVLFRVAERFNPDLGFQFSTYAWNVVRRELNKVVGSGSLIRLPSHAAAALYDDSPEAASLRVLAEAASGYGGFPLDEEGKLTWEPVDDSDDDDPQQRERVADLHEALRSLPGRDRFILEARSGLGWARPQTLKETGTVMGVSREMVRQYEDLALGALLCAVLKLRRERLRMSNATKVKASDVELDPAYYPRSEVDRDVTVPRYAEILSLDPAFDFPPLTVVRGIGKWIVLDGAHRLLAYVLAGRSEVPIIVEDVPEDRWFERAVALNLAHGRPLEVRDRERIVRKLDESGWEVERIAHLLKVRVDSVKAIRIKAGDVKMVTRKKRRPERGSLESRFNRPASGSPLRILDSAIRYLDRTKVYEVDRDQAEKLKGLIERMLQRRSA